MHRKRYRYYWYPAVLDMITNKEMISTEDSIQANIYRRAIDQAIEETQALKDGDERMQAIKMIYFDQTHTVDGVADKLHRCKDTIKKWLQKFVLAVGKNAGFKL